MEITRARLAAGTESGSIGGGRWMLPDRRRRPRLNNNTRAGYVSTRTGLADAWTLEIESSLSGVSERKVIDTFHQPLTRSRRMPRIHRAFIQAGYVG